MNTTSKDKDLLSQIIFETIGPLTPQILAALPDPPPPRTKTHYQKRPLSVKSQNEETIDNKPPLKRKTMSKEDKQKLDSSFPRYELMKILRKHSRKPGVEDFKTSIWDIKYRPTGRKYCGSYIVATAGGHMVNIFDLRINSVISRYEDKDCTETFNCLVWREFVINTFNKYTRDLSILCVGGTKRPQNGSNIVFINGDDITDYLKIESHSHSVNCLEFHSIKKNLLFSGSYDRKVMIWSINWSKMTHISRLSAIEVNKLMEIDCNNRILSLIFVQRLGFVVVGGEDGIVLFKDPNNYKEKSRILRVELPEKTKLVDGLAMIGKDCNLFGFRYKQWIIIADLYRMIESTKKPNFKGLVSLVVVNRLQYCPLKCDYFYMTVESRILCCGDAGGRVLLYYLKDSVLNAYDKENPIEPIRVLPKPDLKSIPIGPESKAPTNSSAQESNDDRRLVFVNISAISPNHEFVVAGTNANLIYVWRRVLPNSQTTKEQNKKLKTVVKV